MKEHGYNPEKAIEILKTRRDFVIPNSDLYNTVVRLIYPTQEAVCSRCGDNWIYIPKNIVWDSKKYNTKEQYQTAVKKEAKIKDGSICFCRKPQVEMKILTS